MRLLLGLTPLVLAATLWAQSDSADNREKAIIQRTKNTPVSSIDNSLPNVTLDFFLQYEASGARITLEVNDCGEQSGNPETDKGRDFPMCVEADFDSNQRNVTLSFVVGTSAKGQSRAVALFSAMITDQTGNIRSLHRLIDLPVELNRPLPRQMRDPQAPTRTKRRPKDHPQMTRSSHHLASKDPFTTSPPLKRSSYCPRAREPSS